MYLCSYRTRFTAWCRLHIHKPNIQEHQANFGEHIDQCRVCRLNHTSYKVGDFTILDKPTVFGKGKTTISTI